MKVLIDYNGLATDATKACTKLLDMLRRGGVTPVSCSSDGKATRTAGVSWRSVLLTFADSQSLELRVKATGDVYQVQLNGKAVPVSAQDDPKKAVAELMGLMDRSRAAFQKRRAALEMKPPEGIKTAAPKLEATLKAQIAEVDEQIEVAKVELAELEKAA